MKPFLDWKLEELCGSCHTDLGEDIFAPKDCYVHDKNILVSFDSEYSVTVSPLRENFIGPLTKVNKTMNGLSSVASVKGEGHAEWTFQDGYRDTQVVKVKGVIRSLKYSP